MMDIHEIFSTFLMTGENECTFTNNIIVHIEKWLNCKGFASKLFYAPSSSHMTYICIFTSFKSNCNFLFEHAILKQNRFWQLILN